MGGMKYLLCTALLSTQENFYGDESILDVIPRAVSLGLVALVVGGGIWVKEALKQKTPAGPESSEGDTETQDPTPRD